MLLLYWLFSIAVFLVVAVVTYRLLAALARVRASRHQRPERTRSPAEDTTGADRR